MKRREARLILDNCNGRLRSGGSFAWAGEQICKTFGGFTSSPAYGCWFPENVVNAEMELDLQTEFRVAIPDTELDWYAFTELARLLASGQKTVYVVAPSGKVEILDVPAIGQATSDVQRNYTTHRMAVDAGC